MTYPNAQKDLMEGFDLDNDVYAEKGKVYTKECIVSFILDLVGYTRNVDLLNCKLLEPSFGLGDFLFPAIERLLSSLDPSGSDVQIVSKLSNSIRAYEVNLKSYKHVSSEVTSMLQRHGFTQADTKHLVSCWLLQGDFLQSNLQPEYTHVVGNPPYIRQELIPDRLMKQYRHRFRTIYDRADLYVPFYEHALSALSLNGSLGFICSDRWTKNRYGSKLRSLIANSYHLKYYIDMYDVNAFHSEVSAYTAITVINRRTADKTTRVVHSSDIDLDGLVELSTDLVYGKEHPSIHKMDSVTKGEAPWLLQCDKTNDLVKRIEEQYPKLEDAGCKVSIGVATGNNRVFFVGENAQIEPDRLLPVIKAEDIASGTIQWPQAYVINPFKDDATGLVNLDNYPKLKQYLLSHKEELASRHVSQKNLKAWYRTIDKIEARKLKLPKLLIPDIKSDPVIAYDAGNYYPNNSLYYITSSDWNLLALRAVLLSGIAKLFLLTYSTKIGSGYIRYQAQYLRRICIPRWSNIPAEMRLRLVEAGKNDTTDITSIVYELYHLTHDEMKIVESMEV
ncbi:Eco57I restriction-modification methylase domain-containing protein [Geobacter sulfurreducens]|uniref:Eco57I restriction-modification methylase domain-containing protein n=1 Tax=Geobacter sulfurreducens TaxID=35554 RepID=UPI000DBBA5F5|nr:Eco57I restriction-modification methylase domain-containing protein [Geobacter sulfurreducens]BBA71031.1 Modification methylase PaeR7I [Geobacter sulfurreducens]